MKKLIVLMVGFTIASAGVYAQTTKATGEKNMQKNEAKAVRPAKEKQTPEAKADHFVTRMNGDVKLDERQQKLVRSLALDHFTAMQAARKSANGDKEKVKAAAKDSRKVFNEGLKKTLTPAQFEAWKAKRKEQAQKKKAEKANDDASDDLLKD